MTSLAAFVLSLFLSLIFVKCTTWSALKIGLVDDPKKRKHPAAMHTKPIPRAGGLPIFLAFLITSLIFVQFSQKFFGIILGGLVLILVGILDDKYDLKSLYKFGGQMLAAVIVVASGIGISFITNPFQLFENNLPGVIRLDEWKIVFDFFGTHSIVILADLFALFWIVWVINMVNFSAGVDGQLGGIALVTLLVIFVASLRFGADPTQSIVTTLAVIGSGATLGFLIFNVYPAKIFPGDSGSYFLGFLIAVLAILAGARVGTAILVMAVPLIDGVFTVVRRIAEGKSPFTGDRKHLHHRLLELGFNPREVSLFYWLLCAILGAVALVLPADQKLFAGVFIAIIVLGGILWINTSLQGTDRK
ncbi:MAG: MraY family glycosyltransferase [Patescibacteria group bacterium]